MIEPARLRSWSLFALLFSSGATGLVYELVWSKHLANLLGNSGQAHSIVLATFMGGLALGAWLFGGLADRVKSPLRLYGLLELGVGAYALLFTPVLALLGELYLRVAVAIPEEARLGPRLLLASLSLLVPTLLMGGTLPALVRHQAASLGGMQRELARLYAINSLGAAFGVLVAGVKLVPSLGLAGAANLAAAINLLLGAAALGLARATVGKASSSQEPGQALPESAVRAALVGVALSGFSVMAYELVWIRLLSMVLGASTYAFTLTLTAFILGIGLGSYVLSRRSRMEDPLLRFGQLQLLLVLAVCAAIPLYARLPYWFWQAHHALNRTPGTWPLYQAITFVFCCGVLLLPTFFMGAAFPCAARAATSSSEKLGRQLGGVYLWNTVGTIAGASLTGLWLMPSLGLEGALALGIGFNLLSATIALRFAPAKMAGPAWLPLAACVALAVLVHWGSTGWTHSVGSAGTFRGRENPPKSFAVFQESLVKGTELLFHRDDTFATVQVSRSTDDQTLWMRINGKPDASTGRDNETQMLVGHLGSLLHPQRVRQALVIGVGSGITIGSLLTHEVERVDVVEISPAVVEAAKLFSEHNRHALDDPRVHVHVDDAKTFMALAGRKYDLIISEPSNPWVVGVSGLFTREFFQRVDEHLAPDGILIQWMHTYESDVELVRLVLRTLRERFPHSTTWLGPLDLVMVASRQDVKLDPNELARRLERPEVAEDLARAHIHGALGLLAKQVHSVEGQAAFAGTGPVNTDDRDRLEYAAPKAFYLARGTVFVQDERRAPDLGKRLALSKLLVSEPMRSEQARWLYENFSGGHGAGAPLTRAAAERWLALSPEDPDAQKALGRSAFEQGDLSLAKRLLGPQENALNSRLEAQNARGWLSEQVLRAEESVHQ